MSLILTGELQCRSRRGADLLITLPFLIDTAGNALDLYDSIEWWDDLNHFGNWILLTGGVMALSAPLRLARWNRAALGIGFAAVAAIAWEIMEYVTFTPNSPEAATAYEDTLGDLALGTLGGTIAAVAGALLIHRRRASRSAGGEGARPGGRSSGSDAENRGSRHGLRRELPVRRDR